MFLWLGWGWIFYYLNFNECWWELGLMLFYLVGYCGIGKLMIFKLVVVELGFWVFDFDVEIEWLVGCMICEIFVV